MTPEGGQPQRTVLVCGSRTFSQINHLRLMLDSVLIDGPILLVHGDAKGADRAAQDWARDNKQEVKSFPAEWDVHADGWCPGEWCQGRRYCVAAGPRRNALMLSEMKPDLCVAFVDKPLAESRGTADMVRRCRAAGVETRVSQIPTSEKLLSNTPIDSQQPLPERGTS